MKIRIYTAQNEQKYIDLPIDDYKEIKRIDVTLIDQNETGLITLKNGQEFYFNATSPDPLQFRSPEARETLEQGTNVEKYTVQGDISTFMWLMSDVAPYLFDRESKPIKKFEDKIIREYEKIDEIFWKCEEQGYAVPDHILKIKERSEKLSEEHEHKAYKTTEQMCMRRKGYIEELAETKKLVESVVDWLLGSESPLLQDLQYDPHHITPRVLERNRAWWKKLDIMDNNLNEYGDGVEYRGFFSYVLFWNSRYDFKDKDQAYEDLYRKYADTLEQICQLFGKIPFGDRIWYMNYQEHLDRNDPDLDLVHFADIGDYDYFYTNQGINSLYEAHQLIKNEIRTRAKANDSVFLYDNGEALPLPVWLDYPSEVETKQEEQRREQEKKQEQEERARAAAFENKVGTADHVEKTERKKHKKKHFFSFLGH